MEHLEELRTRLLRVVLYLGAGMVIAWFFHERLVNFIQKPLLDIHLSMTMTHPTDAINFFIKTSLVGGAILASPFILYQVWLFISPGMYANEKRYVWPFMTHDQPVSRRYLVRLSVCAARRHDRPHPGLRQELYTHDYDR